MSLHVSCYRSIFALERHSWNRLVGPECAPFLEWEWLAQLERSGSVAPQEGWYPLHLGVYRNNRLKAAAPLYLKTHSWGEFVFDFIWQEASAAIGQEYFPKLVGMVPLTPCSAYQFLIATDEDHSFMTTVLLDAIDQLAPQVGAHSCAFHYPDITWMKEIQTLGYQMWMHEGYRWENRGYRQFSDFHSKFSKNQRRNVRRERNALAENNIKVKLIPASEAPPWYGKNMYTLYKSTNDKFGPYGAHFLSPAFFETLHIHVGHRVLYCCATSGDDAASSGNATSSGDATPIAMSMLVYKNTQLYGRYWGTQAYINALHFNLCYYQPLEWAINHGYQFFDPGMGSPYKISRGFRATPTYSLYKFYHQHLNQIMQSNVGMLNRQMQEYLNSLNEKLPIKYT